MQTRRLSSPAALMTCAVIVFAAAFAAATVTAVRQPFLGVRLAPDGDGAAIVRVLPGGPAAQAGIAPGPLDAIAPAADPGARIALAADDVIEEPDSLDSFARLDMFRARQGALHAMLAAGPVTLETGGAPVTVTPAASRPLRSLPLVYWAQILVGAGGLLIGSWVWSLRRDDWGARMFALAGAAMMLSSFAAAVYSTRELALDRDLFRVLSPLNHAGASGFGLAMIGLFLCYPRPIVRPVWLLPLLAGFAGWQVVAVLRLSGDPAHLHAIIMAEMLAIIAVALVQWVVNRNDARNRAALRWLGMSVVVGAGAFVTIVTTPTAFGVTPVVSQGYSFLFFLLIYIGLALGLARYRLFELDQWAYRILFYTGGLIVLILFDAALIYLLSLSHAVALGVSLLLVGFLYLPLRDMMWRRMTRARTLPEDELFRAVVDVAFAGGAQARGESWRALLARLFDPLEIAPVSGPVAAAALEDDGLTLVVPPAVGAPPLALRHPWGGRGLFSAAQLKLAQQLTDLMRHADESRDAYERGAAGERSRIAKDLHDDVGARLLSGLHKPDIAQTRETLRESIADIRTIVSGLSGERLTLDQVLGDLRYEAAQRLEAAGVTLDWPAPRAMPDAPPVDYRITRNLRSVLREAVSNIIRHSGARAVRVTAEWDGAALRLHMQDDGSGFAAKAPGARTGAGLTNMRSRVAELGGECTFPPVEKGAAVALTLPLRG